MRQPRRDKQTMYYSLFNEAKTEYQTDDEGNIVYVEVDGELVPVEIGTLKPSYSTPVKFYSSISSNLNEMHIKSYGVDASSIYCRLCTNKKYIPELNIGTLIWRENEIEWEDAEQTIPKSSSADYTVVGKMKESLTEDFYLLKCNSSEEENDTN